MLRRKIECHNHKYLIFIDWGILFHTQMQYKKITIFLFFSGSENIQNLPKNVIKEHNKKWNNRKRSSKSVSTWHETRVDLWTMKNVNKNVELSEFYFDYICFLFLETFFCLSFKIFLRLIHKHTPNDKYQNLQTEEFQATVNFLQKICWMENK